MNTNLTLFKLWKHVLRWPAMTHQFKMATADLNSRTLFTARNWHLSPAFWRYGSTLCVDLRSAICPNYIEAASGEILALILDGDRPKRWAIRLDSGTGALWRPICSVNARNDYQFLRRTCSGQDMFEFDNML